MKKLMISCTVLSLFVLSSCSLENNERFVKSSTKSEIVDAGKTTKLVIRQCAGKCNIVCGDTENVIINSRCEVSGLNEKNVSSILENTNMKYSSENDELYICFVDLSTGEELNSTATETSLLKSVNISTDLDIVVPESFDYFTIKADVGDISLDSLSGSFDIYSDVGDIRLESASVTGDSVIEANVGNIECSFESVEQCNLDIRSNIGSVEIDTNGLDYTELSRSDKLVEQEAEIMIDGKCSAHLKADVGNVEVKK